MERGGSLRTLGLRDIARWSLGDWFATARDLTILIGGLFIFATGLALGLRCNLGANSWTVLSDGLSRHTFLTIGQASQLTGLVMIAIGWLVGVRPGIGTVLNMVLVGWFLDLELQHGWIPEAHAYPVRVTMMLATVVVLGFATGLYIKAHLGAGPRDSFMLAVTRLTGWPVGINRWLIECAAVVVGILLGGDFGVGTILMALMIGPAVGLGFRLFRLPATGATARVKVQEEGA